MCVYNNITDNIYIYTHIYSYSSTDIYLYRYRYIVGGYTSRWISNSLLSYYNLNINNFSHINYSSQLKITRNDQVIDYQRNKHKTNNAKTKGNKVIQILDISKGF